MAAPLSFCFTPKPAILGVAIMVGGCATFPFSVTLGTAVVLAGLAITTVALAILKTVRATEEAGKSLIKKIAEERHQREEITRQETEKIRNLVDQFVNLCPVNSHVRYLKEVSENLSETFHFSSLDDLVEQGKKILREEIDFSKESRFRIDTTTHKAIRDPLEKLNQQISKTSRFEVRATLPTSTVQERALEPDQQQKRLKKIKKKLEECEKITKSHINSIQNCEALAEHYKQLSDKISDHINRLDVFEKINEAVKEYKTAKEGSLST